MNLVICPTCGTANLYWLNDEKAADCLDYDEKDDALTHHFQCSKCGTSVVVIEPPKEERETEYEDYWIEGKETAD
jgi:rRNA maturation protein Nop10